MPEISQILINGTNYDIKDATARAGVSGLAANKADKTQVESLIAAVGSPLVAATAAAMTDHDKIYVYTGSEAGYTTGYWYYWDGAAWAAGGYYQSAGVNTDKSLSVTDKAADAKATGVAFDEVKGALKAATNNEVVNVDYESGYYPLSNNDHTVDVTSRSSSSTYVSGYVSCQEGDVFIVTGKGGGGSTRPWGFISSAEENNIIQTKPYTDGTWVSNNEVVTAPVNAAYLVLNSNKDELHYLMKNTPLADVVSALDDRLDSFGTKSYEPMKKISVYVYTDFSTATIGWYNSSGDIVQVTENTYHTDKLRINPGDTIYIGQLTEGITGGILGAFFDKDGEYLSSLSSKLDTSGGVISVYDYDLPSLREPEHPEKWVKIYKFTAPANAWYFSRNIIISEPRVNFQYFSNRPVYALKNTGNIVLYEGNPFFEANKNKKICIIGPSTIFIDRYNPNRTAFTHTYTNSDGVQTAVSFPAFNQNIVGFQEYILPYVSSILSLGVSGGGWPSGVANSIYDKIMADSPDLSEYDTFIITGSLNYIEEISSIDAYDTDVTTYYGAIKGVIDYIFNQNPNADIYYTALSKNGNYHFGTQQDEVDVMITEGAKFCDRYGFHRINLTDGVFNYSNVKTFTYDGTHYNQLGSRLIGENLRKILIGF